MVEQPPSAFTASVGSFQNQSCHEYDVKAKFSSVPLRGCQYHEVHRWVYLKESKIQVFTRTTILYLAEKAVVS